MGEKNEMIRRVEDGDAADIVRIYNHYVENTFISFEEEKVDEKTMQSRFLHGDWFVCVEDDVVVGFAYATKWKDRSAYRFTVETSIYIRMDYQGVGMARRLYEHLIKTMKEKGIHSIIATITLPNDKSIEFHKKMGFIKTGEMKEMGYKMNQWADVSYWQLLI